MMKSKVAMAVGSIGGIFIVVYGTSILFQLLFNAYLFEGGLMNLNYGLLGLLCAVPFVLLAVIGRTDKEAKRAVLISALLFSVLFILVHLVLVLSGEVMDSGRVLVIFPVSALLLAVVLYLAAGKEKAVS